MEVPLGPGAEFDRIRAIARSLGLRAADLGDDCARIPDAPGTLVTSTDLSQEGVHFRLDWITLEEAGWRAATAALSDLAAAGASAVGLLAAVAAPRGSTTDDLIAFMRGIGAAAAAVGGSVLGGDLTAGGHWAAAITVMGRAARPMSRRGAAAGDALWVTGTLGGARAALVAWQGGRIPEPASRVAFAHPEARLAAGRWLAAQGATAMMDLSDGLSGDAGHLAAASGIALEIDADRLPVHPGIRDADPRLFAAAGGEDYELLFTMPASFSGTEAAGIALTRIGAVVAGQGVRLLRDGKPVTAPRGYNHFA